MAHEGAPSDPSSASDVEAEILQRLDAANLAPPVADAVLGSVLGPEALAAALRSTPRPRPLATTSAERQHMGPAPGAYLRCISVTGFRGIGPRATLDITPGPGLTLVTGRNGSGKSSFAEAVELAMTGDNMRWSSKVAVWKDGWRNLHSPHSRPGIAVELVVDSERGVTTIRREWEVGAKLDKATTAVQAQGRPRTTLDELGWSRALQTYRPFLSYSELGGLIEGGQADLHDAIQRILNLDQLIEADNTLAAELSDRQTRIKRAAEQVPTLVAALDDNDDSRAAAARAALRAKPIDLAAIERLASPDAGMDAEEGPERVIERLTMPSAQAVTAVVAQLDTADARVAAARGGSAETARTLASLLQQAVTHVEAHDDSRCPVCTAPLPAQWLTQTREQIGRLQREAAEAEHAHRDLAVAMRAAGELLAPAPALSALVASTLQQADRYQLSDIARLWDDCRRALTAADPRVTIATAPAAVDQLRQAVEEARRAAAATMRQRHVSWAPIAHQLRVFADLEHRSRQAGEEIVVLKTAQKWLRAATHDIRNARLAPTQDQAKAIWAQLRHHSSVDLGEITLTGAKTSRRLAIEVRVDGVPGAALGVMSQGELHALSLALFLPRATATGSPFRFLVIDDPVQSMDPAKVDGLARVLADAAAMRQVVVFTHDDRLAESLRRLQLPSTVLEVVRGENSTVQVRTVGDPVSAYLDDARAIARTADMPEQTRALVAVTLCRSALEAAAHTKIRQVRLAAGVPHADVEAAIRDVHTVHEAVTLAVFDDERRGADLMGRLNGMGGWAADAFRVVKTGSHAAYGGDLAALIVDVRRLSDRISA